MAVAEMFAPNYSLDDVARVGPIIESLLNSDRLSDAEREAVDLCCRAAADLASIRHSEVAQRFYARPDVQTQSSDTVTRWLQSNADAGPGTVTSIMGRLHVASVDHDGDLQLTPIHDL